MILRTALVVFYAVCFMTASAATPAHLPGKSRLRKVVGVVTDSLSQERLGFVNVYSTDQKKGTVTDINGVFTLTLAPGSQVEASMLGYNASRKLYTGGRDTLRIYMSPSSTTLEEVVVRPKKQKYSKKNNPAVELMKRVRDDYERVDPRREKEYNYDRYEKITIGINDYKGYMDANADDRAGKNGKKRRLMTSLIDTAIWTGKRILDISLKEKAATRIFRDGGQVAKEIVTARKSNGFDKAFDENMTRVVVEDALREVNIHDGDIGIMRSNFVSPLSPIGPDYYKYFLEDTVQIGNERCVEISFSPRNAESMGFNGKMFIPADDSVKYVKRVLLRLPKAANVNYVENLVVSQTFFKDSTGNVHKMLDDMVVELRLIPGTTPAYVARQSRYDSFSYQPRKDLEKYYSSVGTLFELDGAGERDSGFWDASRMIPLTYAEKHLSVSDSPFRDIPLLYWTEKVVEVIIKGYVATGRKSKFDFGPIDTFVSYNATEGMRFAVGGLTTANLSSRLFGRGYVAWGLRDHKWKYNAELEYSFNDKKYWSREFPVNSILASYTYDINKLGQHYLSNAANNLLNSLKRLQSNLSTYHRVARLEYQVEWRNHMSFLARFQHERQEESDYVRFMDGMGNGIAHYNQTSLRLQFRYAPNEKFIQTANERRPVNRDGFIFLVSHEFGPKGLLGSAFTMNLTEAMVQKRFWLSAFGYMDVLVRGGKLWNQVQFPALLWQNANTAYTMQTETYALLNPMEFAMDEYASLDFTYFLNGLLFNRIPFVNKLRLREVFSFKGFVGHLSQKNNPEYNPHLFRFPDAATKPMGPTPYMEIGVGIDNILTFLRLDYVWRLSYRDTPGAPNSGLRFSFHFSF